MNTDKKPLATQLNVRVSVEDQARFQKLCDQKGFKQAEGFNFLLDTLTLQQAAEKDKNRHENLMALKHHTQAILDLFAGNCAIMDTLKESVREEFITDLSRLGEIEHANTQLINKQSQLEVELKETRRNLADSERNCAALQKELSIKQERVTLLENRLEKAKDNADVVEALREESSGYLKEVLALKDQLDKVRETLTKQSLEHERALRDADNKYRDQIQKLSDEKHSALQELARLSKPEKA